MPLATRCRPLLVGLVVPIAAATSVLPFVAPPMSARPWWAVLAWPALAAAAVVAAVGWGVVRERWQTERLSAAMARYATLHPEHEGRRGR